MELLTVVSVNAFHCQVRALTICAPLGSHFEVRGGASRYSASFRIHDGPLV